MNAREYFVLGCKLLGVWCLFMSIIPLTAAITTFGSGPNMGEEYASIMFLTRVVMRLTPILYIVAGIYLLKNGTILHNFAYPPEDSTKESFDIHEKFALFLKLLGVYLIVNYFPDLLKSISSYFTYLNAPPAFDMFQQKSFTYVNLIPSTAAILLGCYLLKNGQFFIRLAFEKKDNVEKEED